MGEGAECRKEVLAAVPWTIKLGGSQASASAAPTWPVLQFGVPHKTSHII